jgi:hypothetical protein
LLHVVKLQTTIRAIGPKPKKGLRVRTTELPLVIDDIEARIARAAIFRQLT